MMNCFLKNKKGVTILEGLIALGLLALVAGGTFGVLLSVSRKSSQPDIREEMVLAVERANEQLQMYTGDFSQGASHTKGLCGNDNNPLSTDQSHVINCMLPAICDQNNSFFYYEVSNVSFSNPLSAAYYVGAPTVPAERAVVTFNITCNGFTL